MVVVIGEQKLDFRLGELNALLEPLLLWLPW